MRLCLPPVGAKGHEKAQQWKTVTLDVDGQVRAFRGGREVFGWYRGYGHAGNVVPSALMALEQWLYQRLDAKESVDEAVGQVLRTGSSVALLGVLAALARKEPELIRGCLRPLMTSWMLLSWDDQLTVQASVQANMPDFDPFYLKALNGWIGDEAERWGKLRHRSVRLQWLVATGLALGDQALIEQCRTSRTGWQAEIDAGECLEAEEAQRLIALLDPANLSARALGDGRIQVEVRWPEDLAAKYDERGKRSGPEIIAFQLRTMMRKAMDAGTPLQVEQAEAIWKVANELGDPGAPDEGEETNSPIVARAAAADALETLAPDWLDQFPERRAWCEASVIKACEVARRGPSFAYGMSMYKEHVEAFTGEWALARLLARDGRAEVRHILAYALTADEHIVTGQVLASAMRQAPNLGDDLGRLFNLLWLWAALKNLKSNGSEDRASGQKIDERRRSSLIHAFVVRQLSSNPIPWDDLRLRAARVWERSVRAQRRRSPSWSWSVRSSHEDLGAADASLPQNWHEYRDDGFNHRVLECAIEGLRLTLGSSLGLNLGPLVELDQRLLDMSEFALQKEPLDDRRSCRFPSEFDSLTLERLSVRVAAHADESQAMTIWARLQPLLPQHADWCETFFGYWFTQPRDCLEHVERFHRRWRAMIRSVSSSFQWNPENASHFPHLGRAWSALLGVLPDGTSLGLEVDQPHLAQLEPYYQEWASWGLLDRRQF